QVPSVILLSTGKPAMRRFPKGESMRKATLLGLFAAIVAALAFTGTASAWSGLHGKRHARKHTSIQRVHPARPAKQAAPAATTPRTTRAAAVTVAEEAGTTSHPEPAAPLPGRLRREAAGARVAELFARHGAAVLGLCRMLLRHREEAEDAMQQTFLSAYRSL